MTDRIIIGTGRHAVETYYLLQDIGEAASIICFVQEEKPTKNEMFGVPIKTMDQVLIQYAEQKPLVIVAIGNTTVNVRITRFLHENGFCFFNAISSSVNVTRQKFIGKGVTVAQGSIITANVSIDDFTIINVGCTISHDVSIGKNVNISPGCHLAGHVIVEDEVFMGVGVSIIPKVRIGKGALIAAGATVIEDVAAYTMVAGIPAVVKKQITNR
jgi:sugar O-acyltransferase (sialic acid O-acetyltransferase NeuD family)